MKCSKCESENCEKRYSLGPPLMYELICLDCGNVDKYAITPAEHERLIQRAQARTYLDNFSKEELISIIIQKTFGEDDIVGKRIK